VTDVVGGGLARETVGAADGVLQVAGLVRETVVLQASATVTVILSGLVREAVVLPGSVVPSVPRQYAVTVIG
jgi:hypothetical protein